MIKAINRYLPNLVPVFVALLALAAVSCSSDDLVADDAAESADECVELRAEVVSSPVTRSQTALQSAWSEDDEMAIQVIGEAKIFQYKVKDASTGELIEHTGQLKNYMMWRAGETAKRIHAWSYGGIYENTLPTNRSFAADQSTAEAFQAQDFLYCPPTDVQRNGTFPSHTLSFQHAMTRVHVFVRADADESVTAVNEVKVQSKLTGTFSYASNNMTWTTSGNYAIVTPLQMNAEGTGYLSAHTAILVPQAMGGTNALLQIKAVKNNVEQTYRYTPPTTNGVDVLQPGIEYLLYVSFTAGTVQISVVQLTSDWTSSGLSGQIVYVNNMPCVDIQNWDKDTSGINTGNNSTNGNIGNWVGDDPGDIGKDGEGDTQPWTNDQDADTGKDDNGTTQNWTNDDDANIGKDNDGSTQNWQQDGNGNIIMDSNDAPSSIGTVGNWVQFDPTSTVYAIVSVSHMPYIDVYDWVHTNGSVNTGTSSTNGNTETWTEDPAANTGKDDNGTTQNWTNDDDANTGKDDNGTIPNWSQDSDGNSGKDDNGTIPNWTQDSDGSVTQDDNGTVGTWQNSDLPGTVQDGTPPTN